MMPVSGVTPGAARPVAAEALGAPGVQKPGEGAGRRPPEPVMDEYVPEEKGEPSGRYWLGRGEDGQPKLYVDGQPRAADEVPPDADNPEGAKGPGKGGGTDEVCVGSTDKVDREIERLKKKLRELEQRHSTETDEARRKALERKLAQVERELDAKDNDAYRRQHATFTRLS